ncbi:Holliday junction branch migration protein RuvA [Bifidobacterium leontopitheci]|uniref:Holliday junction branch migration complex subunit RuvA n=1 Tax=Bifidobacterium leontopitheci TaxID=2650774 RepID=A0A6I1GMZ5_9BIFI|nr:Holliday junction branch migration protein RuvA [Bifidobacterium leontopitheci]KAB7790779.1 ATP-dependent DNA helicase RuvA [Bifidobacterium leontopitheci]
MIGTLRGRVESIETGYAVIEVHDVGYEVRMPMADLAALHTGQEAHVHTSMTVSQDAITLFGFLSLASKRMFLQLQKVSGIGPKVALSLLSTLPADRLAQAVTQGDAAALAKAPGLGKKGAQKIILELAGRIDLDQLDTGAEPSGELDRDDGAAQVVEGLVSLGWRQQTAQDAVRQVCREQGITPPITGDDVPRVLKLALSSLDRGR